MFAGGTYLRGLWKQKPNAWGPVDVVSAVLAERLGDIYGISWSDVIIVSPCWGPGYQYNYALNLHLSNTGVGFDKNAITFLNDGDYLSIYRNHLLSPEKMTVLAIANPYSLGDSEARVMSMDSNYRNWQLNLADTTSGNSRFLVFDDNGSNANARNASSVSTNTDHLIAGSYDGSTIKCHIDNEVVNTTAALTTAQHLADFYVGVDNTIPGSHQFNGEIKLLLYLSCALSDDQVLKIYDNPYALIQPPTFRTFSLPSGTPTILNLADIAQAQTIDNLDLVQQAILAINSIDQSQIIDNITLSLSQNLIIAGISQSQIIDNISLLQQIALVINSLQQTQVIDANDLIQQSLLSIQELSQTQVIDNLTLLSAAILTIAELNQAQQIDNLDLLQQSNIIIADTVQNQLLDNIILLYGDVLAITGISQSQTSDNIALIQQNLLSVADINQIQTTDNVTISVAGLLEIANLVQAQNLDVINLQQNFALVIDSLFQTQNVNNIILDSSQILAIQQLVQTQLVDVISLVQQSVLNVDEISQQQILDNIEIVITRISGKLSITFQLKTPGGRFTLR